MYFSPVTQKTAFHTKIKERYGEDAHMMHIDAYDAANILLDALQACPDHKNTCMLEYVTSLQGYQGAGGEMSFNKDLWGV